MCIKLKLQKKVWRDKFITGDNKGDRRTTIKLREAVTQKGGIPIAGTTTRVTRPASQLQRPLKSAKKLEPMINRWIEWYRATCNSADLDLFHHRH